MMAIHCHLKDADVDIAKTAVAAAETKPTTLIGEDTNLLILLLYYCKEEGKSLHLWLHCGPKVFNIICTEQVFGSEMCTHCYSFMP